MTTPAETITILHDLGVTLRDHYGTRLVDLVLFGSRARGDADPASDYDVLVVLAGDVDSGAERHAMGDRIYRLCWKHNAVILCHFVGTERYRREQSPFMLNIRREGVLV